MNIFKVININIGLFIIGSIIVLLTFDLSRENLTWQGQGYYRLDHELGFTHRASIPFDIIINDQISYRGSLNSLGLRGPELNPNSETIYLAGDSQVFGWGLNQDQTFANLLRNSTPKYNIANAGVAGFGTDQSYARFLTMYKKLPTLSHVIFFLNTNDMDMGNGVEFSLYDLRDDKLIKKNLVNSLEYRMRKLPLQQMNPLKKKFLVNLSTIFSLYWVQHKKYQKEKNYRAILVKQLTHLIFLSKKENFKLSLVELPNKELISSFDWLRDHDEIAPYYADLNKIPNIQKESENIFLSDQEHLNSKGAKLLANEIKSLLDLSTMVRN